MITTHTFNIPTNTNGVNKITSHPIVSPFSISATELSVVNKIKLAALVDTSKDEVDYEIFVNHTGKLIPDEVSRDNDLELIGHRTVDSFNDGVYGCSLILLKPKNTKTIKLRLTISNPNVSADTLSSLLLDIIQHKLTINDDYMKVNVSVGNIERSDTKTDIHFNVTEDFFNRYYGAFASNARSIPSFHSFTFESVA